MMQTVLVTGAAGAIDTRSRKLLKGVYPDRPQSWPTALGANIETSSDLSFPGACR